MHNALQRRAHRVSNGAPPEAARASFEQLLFDPQSVFGKGAQEVRHLEWVHVVNDVGERNQPHQSPAVVDHQDPSALALRQQRGFWLMIALRKVLPTFKASADTRNARSRSVTTPRGWRSTSITGKK